jgi:protein-tyrosine phosphatase
MAQPDKKGFESLVYMGVNHIIKLNSNDEYPDQLEQTYFDRHIVFDPYPKLFVVPPIEKVKATVKTIHDIMITGDSLAVHCTHGVDRTGLVIGAWRIITQKWTMEQVQEERYAYGASKWRDIPDYNIVKLLEKLAEENK